MRFKYKPRILIVGCGDVGLRLIPLLRQRFKIYALTSSPERLEELRARGICPIYGNLDEPESLIRIAAIAPEIIVHLAPPQNMGAEDLRTRHLLAALGPASRSLQRFVYISTTGVYGDHQGAWVTETSPLKTLSDRAMRRVSAEQQVRAWAVSHQVRAHILRVPGIYAFERLPIERLQKGTPALRAEEDVYTSHIHADDLARLIWAHLYRGKNQRVVNACDNQSMPMADYFDQVADVFELPRPPRVTRTELTQQVSPMMLSFMSESRRLKNQRLQELRFHLQYPTVADFLAFTSSYLLNSRSD